MSLLNHPISKQRRASLLDLPTELHKIIIKARRDDTPQALMWPSPKYNWVLDIRSLSTVAKGITDVCQEELFQDIHIHGTATTKDYGSGGCKWREVQGSIDTMSAFCELLKARPHLGAYARALVFDIPSPNCSTTRRSFRWNDNISAAIGTTLSLMTMVTTLTLRYHDHSLDWPSPIPGFHQQEGKGLAAGLLSILGSQRLQHISLYNVVLPAWALAKSKQLKTLELDEALVFYWDPEEYPNGPVQEGPIYLDRLVLKVYTARGLLKTEMRRQHSNISLSKVTKFEGATESDRLELFLREMAGLEVLQLGLEYFLPGNVATEGALSYLNPHSFATLKELKVFNGFELHLEFVADNIIRDPYQGLTRGGTLVQLIALQRLEILVSFAGKIGEAPELNIQESFGEEWGTLEAVLLPLGRECPLVSLEQVSLTIVYEGGKYDPSGFLVEEFRRRVLSRHFVRLRASEKPRFSHYTEESYSRPQHPSLGEREK